MANQTLRELAQEHAQGNLDKDSYRKSRAELIQGIVSDSIPLAEIDYPPLVQPAEPENLDDTQRKEDYKKAPVKNADPQSATSPKPGAGKSPDTNADNGSGTSSTVLIVGLILAIVAIVIIGVLAFVGMDDKSKSPATASSATEVNTSSTAETLIQTFLNNKNWSSSSLDDFQQQWAELSVEDIQTAEDSVALGQLTNAIFKQLLEEQALSGLVDDDSSLNKQRELVEFATELGIDDERISLPEELEVMAEEFETDGPELDALEEDDLDQAAEEMEL